MSTGRPNPRASMSTPRDRAATRRPTAADTDHATTIQSETQEITMTIVGFGRARFAALVIVATTGAVQTGALAQQAPSVPEVFQKYNLIGTFAWDCSKPASPNNLYF